MENTIKEVEKFLRYLSQLTAEEKKSKSSEISELAQHLAEQLEPISDGEYSITKSSE